MSYTTINKSSLHMNTKLYSGNGGTQSITGVGFQPDFTWIKQRTGTTWHNLYDAVRGATKSIASNDNGMEGTRATGLTSFNSDGFSLGSDSNANAGSGSTYVSWNWKAGGSGSSNTDGSITSTVSANTVSGFSIIKFDGTEANGSVGHGLGVSPSMFILRRYTDDGYSSTSEWYTYHKSLGGGNRLTLQSTSAQGTNDGSLWNTSTPVTNSVINIGFNANSNNSGTKSIIYAFAEKQGFSKFGNYTGNGGGGSGTDGTFIYLGFKPAFVMTKRTDGTGGWFMQDNKRLGYNYANYRLFADATDSESTASRIDLLSNGFKCRDNDGNGNGFSYIYMAFAEAPLVGSNNVPCTAR